jgi:acyl-CoA synthetase (AMP-forming)/AMP-acid ligase II
MPLYLTQGVHRAVQQSPARIATIFGKREQTYSRYGDRIARLAAALRTLGVAKGDRVGMLALNSDRYLEYFFGTWWGGYVVNPVNFRWSAAEIAYSLDDCDTRILLVDDQFKGLIDELRKKSQSLKTVIHAGDGDTPAGALSYEKLLAHATPMTDSGCGGPDLAAVFYTGGTTGFPKGVMLSHDNLSANAMTALAEGFTHGEARALLIAPMFHLAAGALMNAHAFAGGTFVIAPMFTPVGALQIIQEQKVTHVLLVPTMIQVLADHPDAAKYDLSSVKMVLYGASTISEAVLNRAMALLSSAGFMQAYGMTELAPIATVMPPRYHTAEGRKAGKLRSAGRATMICEVRIVDIDGREVPRGTVGEVAVRGPGVMLGYWNKPELTANAIRNGWMHTGDGAYMDDDGFVFIVDRLKDMIISGGENIYSVEVENALAQHPAVGACAVIGIPSEEWGEAVHAVVVLKPGMTAKEVEMTAHCKTLIAGYKCPRSIEFRAALPLSGAGKILKTELRKPFWAGHERNVN